MTVDDVSAAIELVANMHFISASRLVADMLNIELSVAYDLIVIARSF